MPLSSTQFIPNEPNNKMVHPVLKPLEHPQDPAVHQRAARYAVRVLEEMSKRSTLLQYDDEDDGVAAFERDEILPYLGELLGKGGFNNVYELERIELQPASNTSHLSSFAQQQRTLIATTKPKLAVKFLSDEALESPDDFCNGAADLLLEAKYLTALAAHPHPALIQLHGVGATGPTGFGKVERAGFFLIIDRLYDTLDRRIDVWKEVSKRRRVDEGSSSHRKAMCALLVQRLLVGQEIVSALRHLHRLQVIFRDLKPGTSFWAD